MKSAAAGPAPREEMKRVPLPHGWRCHVSPKGPRNYVNTASNETTWELPFTSYGTSVRPLVQRHSLPEVNGSCHTTGSAIHTRDPPDVPLRRATMDKQQSPGNTSPAKRQTKEMKETKITINCVTFPIPNVTPDQAEQQLLKPNEWSYCDYFWTDKKDPQGTTSVAGFEVLLQKQLKGKQMQKEMAEFIRERIKIEEEYAKNLSKLSQSPLAAQEEGTLGEAWAQLKRSCHDEAEVHLKFSNKVAYCLFKTYDRFNINGSK